MALIDPFTNERVIRIELKLLFDTNNGITKNKRKVIILPKLLKPYNV